MFPGRSARSPPAGGVSAVIIPYPEFAYGGDERWRGSQVIGTDDFSPVDYGRGVVIDLAMPPGGTPANFFAR